MQLLVPVYIGLCLVTISIYLKRHDGATYNYAIKNVVSLFFLLLFVAIVASRPFNYPGDTAVYLSMFEYLSNIDTFSIPLHFRLESGYLYLNVLLGFISGSERYFMISIALIQAVLWYVCFYFWVDNKKLLLCVLVFVSLFTSYNLGANLLRQGLAMPLGLIGLKFLLDRRFFLAFFTIAIGVSFHKSILLFFIAWVFTLDKVDIKYYLGAWLLCSIMSFFGILSNITRFFLSDGSSYQHLVTEATLENYRTGFRLDFWLFSLIPMALFYFVDFSKKYKYFNVMKAYLVLFSIFVIMFDVPYSDRVGIYTWVMLPIALTLFIDDYKFSLLNSTSLVAIAFMLIGTFLFQFYPIMDISIHLKDVF